MPKASRLRSKVAKHLPAAKSSKEKSQAEKDPEDESSSLPYTPLTKKERRLYKKEVFQEYVVETLEKAVHSKSSQRRAKRREKERLAADMSDIGIVLRTVEQDEQQVGKVGENPSTATSNKKIGETTRAKPLTKQEKKKALAIEQRRLPLILSHPAFKADTFATLRTHTSNVLERIPNE